MALKLRINSASSQEHRTRILNAAAECFMRDGYEAATIDDIAAMLESTKGRIYYSYRSKADLFFAVFERGMEMTLAVVEPFLAGSAPALQRLRGMGIAHTLLLMEQLPYHIVSRQGIEAHLSRAMTPAQRETLGGLIALRDRYEKLYATVIAEGVADGSIREAHASIAAKTFLGALNSVAVWYRPRAGQDRADRLKLAESVVDIVVNGFAGDASRLS